MLAEMTRVRLLIEPSDDMFGEEDTYRVHKGYVGTVIEVYPGDPVRYYVDFTDPSTLEDDNEGNSCTFLSLTEDQIEAVED